MKFFQTLKRLFQGYDITEGGSSPAPRNREERRAQAKGIKKANIKVKGRAM